MRGSLADRVADLEAQLSAAALAGRQRLARPPLVFPPRHIRLAVTCPDGGGGYPAAPCDTFPVKTVDATFTEAAGVHNVSKTNRAAQSMFYARTFPGENSSGWYIPNTSLVVLGRMSGRWWIVKAPHKALWVRGTIHTNGSGVIDVSEFWQGLDPRDGSGRVTAVDEDGVFTLTAGKPCRACYKPESDTYSLLWVKC
jgi:hypothetical protein